MSIYYRSTKAPCGDALISIQSKLYFCDSDTHTLNEILIKITNSDKFHRFTFLSRICTILDVDCQLLILLKWHCGEFYKQKIFLAKKTKKKENEVCNKDASKSLSLGVHLSTLPNNSMTLKFINVRQILKTYHKSLHF